MVLWEQGIPKCLRKLEWPTNLWMNSSDGQQKDCWESQPRQDTGTKRNKVSETLMRSLDCISRQQSKTQGFNVS